MKSRVSNFLVLPILLLLSVLCSIAYHSNSALSSAIEFGFDNIKNTHQNYPLPFKRNESKNSEKEKCDSEKEIENFEAAFSGNILGFSALHTDLINHKAFSKHKPYCVVPLYLLDQALLL